MKQILGVGGYIIAGVSLVLAGYMIGGMTRVFVEKPVAIYERQIGSEQNKYLILELRNKSVVPFVKQADGTYRRVDESGMSAEEVKGLIKKLEQAKPLTR